MVRAAVGHVGDDGRVTFDPANRKALDRYLLTLKGQDVDVRAIRKWFGVGRSVAVADADATYEGMLARGAYDVLPLAMLIGGGGCAGKIAVSAIKAWQAKTEADR